MPHKMIEHIEQSPNGDDYREKLVAAEHGLRGDTVGITRIITMILALCWSLFQLASASILLLDTVYIRAIHLECMNRLERVFTIFGIMSRRHIQ